MKKVNLLSTIVSIILFSLGAILLYDEVNYELSEVLTEVIAGSTLLLIGSLGLLLQLYFYNTKPRENAQN